MVIVMRLTGNPFVDNGLMVLAALAAKDSVDELSLSDIRQVFGSGEELARNNQALKSFTMVFGTNGPLTQPAYRKSGSNKAIYLAIVRQLLDIAEQEGESGDRCDLSGVHTTLDFQSICAKALRDANLPIPEQKWLGRDWVPLGGSLGNDAQALPVASRSLRVSAIALFALQYLPLGVSLLRGKLCCPQATRQELAQAWVGRNVELNRDRIAAGSREILGKGAGSGAVLDQLLHCYDEVSYAPGEAVLWLFSNSGAGADCETVDIPDRALSFVSQAHSRFGSEIRALIGSESKDSRQQLFECLRGQRDYPGLYSDKKLPGASAEFYDFYQEQICDASKEALAVARKLANLVLSSARNAKDLKEIRKPEYLRSAVGRNRVRRTIAEQLTMAEYDALFPSQHHPIRTQPAGWNYLRFYLSTPTQDRRAMGTLPTAMKTTHPKIVKIAETYRAADPKKIKNLLDRMMQRKIGVRWLQDKFCVLATEHKDWELGDWDEFVCDDEGNVIAFELLFQIRLYLSNLYREVTTNGKGEAA